jgi:hypothetical protein
MGRGEPGDFHSIINELGGERMGGFQPGVGGSWAKTWLI